MLMRGGITVVTLGAVTVSTVALAVTGTEIVVAGATVLTVDATIVVVRVAVVATGLLATLLLWAHGGARRHVPQVVLQEITKLNSLDVELYKHAQDIFARQHSRMMQKLVGPVSAHLLPGLEIYLTS
ncbi:hypothetical protein RJ639_042712 [Escallonia herrerae]|uniref:Uncharacterized protein n=1 Tax=Escallonia herrerae TaxID=1293975 RepID=A0AA88WBQ2_9ASTE|nr:hypothetical protein RJ639_042712 [Escallonia herrerae]